MISTKRQLAATWLAFALTVARAGDTGIDVSLDPTEIELGSSAQMTITVTGSQSKTPELPSVAGLSFDPIGQSSQFQVINGATSSQVTHTYLVTADHAGTYTIPKVTVARGVEVASSRPVVLRVLKGGSTRAAANSGRTLQQLPNPVVPSAKDDQSTDVRNGVGFVKVVTPKTEFYVGEVVPVELKAFIRPGAEVRLDGPPQLNNDAFMMQSPGSSPARTQEFVGGEPFVVFTWSTTLTAVKGGDHELSVELPTTVTIRQRASRPRVRPSFGSSFFDDAFDDSFFDHFFGGATQKQMKFASPKLEIKALPLPPENRPAGFAGAVGQFEIDMVAVPERVSMGDPVTLKVAVTGRGNFDRVSVSLPDQEGSWKSYKPGTKFDPTDSVGFEGKKTFEFALVAQKHGSLGIAPIEFSFFDPDARQYVTRTTQRLSAEVSPPSGKVESMSQPSSTTAGINSAANREAIDGKSPAAFASAQNAGPTHTRGSLSGWLWPALLVMPGLGCAVWLFRRRRVRSSDPSRLRSQAVRQAIRQHVDRMESAATRGASAEFFTAARCALRERLGERFNLRPGTITLGEINLRLNGNGDILRSIFTIADEVTFTGRNLSAEELQSWSKVVNSELKKLEAI